eukprot:scaffold96297_cov53-Attheya_sp.AAC.1
MLGEVDQRSKMDLGFSASAFLKNERITHMSLVSVPSNQKIIWRVMPFAPCFCKAHLVKRIFFFCSLLVRDCPDMELYFGVGNVAFSTPHLLTRTVAVDSPMAQLPCHIEHFWRSTELPWTVRNKWEKNDNS